MAIDYPSDEDIEDPEHDNHMVQNAGRGTPSKKWASWRMPPQRDDTANIMDFSMTDRWARNEQDELERLQGLGIFVDPSLGIIDGDIGSVLTNGVPPIRSSIIRAIEQEEGEYKNKGSAMSHDSYYDYHRGMSDYDGESNASSAILQQEMINYYNV